MPSARASAIWLRPALRSTSTSRPNSPGVSASPAFAKVAAKSANTADWVRRST